MQTQTLELPAANAATRLLIADYENELHERRSQLLDDLAVYEGKVRDLDELDPLDFTGLGKLYRSHIDEIKELLKEFDSDGAP